jgi:hypothetical protein
MPCDDALDEAAQAGRSTVAVIAKARRLGVATFSVECEVGVDVE